MFNFITCEVIGIFGNIIYYDDKKISEYRSVILRQQSLKVKEYEVQSDKFTKLNLKFIGGDLKGSKKYTAEVEESLLYNCDNFEKLLYDRDDFFDFTTQKFDIKTIGRGIIKFNGYMFVPQEFDITQTIQKFKPFLIDSISSEHVDETEQKVFKTLFESTDTKIPIILELEDALMCSKLISSNMLIEYEDLEEFEELEITIVARVTSASLVGKNKPFYDPLKDFMKINRLLRRSIGERTEGLYEIYADQDYKTIEVLAIYQWERELLEKAVIIEFIFI